MLASLVVRFPVFLFLHNAFFIQNKRLGHDFAGLCQWDCVNYASLAADLKPSAFFPLLPLFSKLGILFSFSPEVSVLITSILFSVLAGIGTLYLFDRFFEHFYPASNLGRKRYLGFNQVAWAGFLIFSFFPQSHFAVRGYSEPVFWFLMMSWGYFRLSGSFISLFFLSLLPLSRPQGIWLFGLVLVFEVLNHFRNKTYQRINGLILSLTPIVFFLIWNHIETGNWIYFLQAQTGWSRVFDWRRGIDAHLPRILDASLYLYLGLFSVVYFLRQKTWPLLIRYGLATGALAFTEIPLWFGGLYSYSRFGSIHFGIFWVLAVFLFNRRVWLALWLIWSFSRLSLYSHRAGFGHWVESQGVPQEELYWLPKP